MLYTIREELARIGDPAGTTYPFSARYTYHGNGTVNEAEFYSAGSPAAQKRYRYVMGTTAYDAINRLKSADYSPWSGSAWTSTLNHDLSNIGYDDSGNLTTFRRYRQTGTLIDNLTYTIPGSSNRMSSVAEAAGVSSETWDAEAGSFTYDANGNIKTMPGPYGITSITYDHRNQSVVLTNGAGTTYYRYNGGGWRIFKQAPGGGGEVYIQDGPVTLAAFYLHSADSTAHWHFNILAGDKVVGRQPHTGSKSYYHTDLLGSTRAVLQGATVTESYDYDPYGMLMPGRTLAGGTKEGFTGKERDSETGLDYFGQRVFMPAFGRWSTVDPVADSFPEWNPYNYVEGNPASRSDQFGLNPECPGCANAITLILARQLLESQPDNGSVRADPPGLEVVLLPFAAGRVAVGGLFGRFAGRRGASQIGSLAEAFAKPSLLKGKAPGQLADVIKAAKDGGWLVESLGKGSAKGRGLILREVNDQGKPTGRMIQWHPGGGHHGPDPYWKVSSPAGGTKRVDAWTRGER